MKPLCILGILQNDKGLQIASEMMSWISPLYEVIPVYHDGVQFEYPALHKLQELLIKDKQSALYLHTKGSVNTHRDTEYVRNMWKYEFTVNRDLYFSLVNRPWPMVACPFTGSDKTTWFNGFVVNWQAMAEISEISPTTDRKRFEKLFRGTNVNVIGVLRSDVERGEKGHVTRMCMNTMKLL